MDLRDVEYFAVIAEHGHLGRAAESLGLGQPALSVSLRRLEKAANAKLAKRTAKGIELTDAGNVLLAHVRRLRLARDDVAREIADLAHGRTGSVRVGTGPAISEGFLPQACSVMALEAPRVTLTMTIGPATATLLPALRQGEIDLIVTHFTAPPEQGIAVEVLWNDEFVVYAAARQRLARLKSVAVSELVTARWASTAASAFYSPRSLQRVFAERGLPPPQFALISDSVMLRLRTVASSSLLGIASRQVVERNARALRLKIIPVRDLKWIRPVAVAYRTDGYLAPAARRFIEVLKVTAREIADSER